MYLAGSQLPVVVVLAAVVVVVLARVAGARHARAGPPPRPRPSHHQAPRPQRLATPEERVAAAVHQVCSACTASYPYIGCSTGVLHQLWWPMLSHMLSNLRYAVWTLQLHRPARSSRRSRACCSSFSATSGVTQGTKPTRSRVRAAHAHLLLLCMVAPLACVRSLMSPHTPEHGLLQLALAHPP